MIILALLIGLALGRLLANQHRLDDQAAELSFRRHPSDPNWSPRTNLRVINGSHVFDFDDEGFEHDGGGAA